MKIEIARILAINSSHPRQAIEVWNKNLVVQAAVWLVHKHIHVELAEADIGVEKSCLQRW